MHALFKAFFDICLLRRGPQDLPPSRLLFQLTAIAGVLVGTLIMSADGDDPLHALLAQGLDQFFIGAILYTALSLQRQRGRFFQAASAVYGSGLLVTLALVPLMILAAGATAEDPRAQLAGLLFLVLLGWNIAILGHILRHTFDIPFIAALIFGLGYFLFINELISELLGA